MVRDYADLCFSEYKPGEIMVWDYAHLCFSEYMDNGEMVLGLC